eukprot:366510-Chlamydomonas_euryale.AAC.8
MSGWAIHQAANAVALSLATLTRSRSRRRGNVPWLQLWVECNQVRCVNCAACAQLARGPKRREVAPIEPQRVRRRARRGAPGLLTALACGGGRGRPTGLRPKARTASQRPGAAAQCLPSLYGSAPTRRLSRTRHHRRRDSAVVEPWTRGAHRLGAAVLAALRSRALDCCAESVGPPQTLVPGKRIEI